MDGIVCDRARRLLSELLEEVVYPFQPSLTSDRKVTLEEIAERHLRELVNETKFPAAGRAA